MSPRVQLEPLPADPPRLEPFHAPRRVDWDAVAVLGAVVVLVVLVAWGIL